MEHKPMPQARRAQKLPNSKTQQYLFWIGLLGVMTACFGCGLASQNQMRAAQLFLIVAWLILVPLFGFLLRTRRRIKKVVRKRYEQSETELQALANAGDILSTSREKEEST